MRSYVISSIAVLMLTLMLAACGGPPGLSWETINTYNFNVVEAEPNLRIPARDLYELMYFSRLAAAGGSVSDSAIQSFRDSVTVDTLISLSCDSFDLASYWYYFRDYRDRAYNRLRQDFWQQEVGAKIVVDSQEVIDYYEGHPEEFSLPDQIDMYHILSSWLGFAQGPDSTLVKRYTREDLQAFSEVYIRRLYQLLLYGEPFQNVAFNYSHDVLSRDRGGHLGWTTRETYMDPFDSVAFSLKDGEFSEPYSDSDGWHIIYRARYLPGGPQPLDSPRVYVQAQQAVFDLKATQEATRIIDSLRKLASIEINEVVLSDSIIYSIEDSVWAAVVNGTDTVDVMRLKGLEETYRRGYGVNSTTPQMRRIMISEATGPVLIVQAARYLGLDTLSGYREAERDIKFRATKALRLALLFSSDDYQPSDSGIAEYYNQHLEEFTPDENIRAEQLVTQDEELAYFLRDQIAEGFALKYLADYYGDLEGYDVKYEDLGVVTRESVDSVLYEALERTHAHYTTKVIKTKRGYHLAKVIDRDYELPLSMVKGGIKTRLIEEYRRHKWEAFRDKMFLEYNVRFPGVLPSFELPRLSQRNHPRSLPIPANVQGY
jgi:hypothetical protein